MTIRLHSYAFPGGGPVIPGSKLWEPEEYPDGEFGETEEPDDPELPGLPVLPVLPHGP